MGRCNAAEEACLYTEDGGLNPQHKQTNKQPINKTTGRRKKEMGKEGEEEEKRKKRGFQEGLSYLV